MKTFRLESELLVPVDVEQAFRFFCDPWNLQAITPPWLRFRVLGASTPAIQEGTEIDYALRVRGLPMRWRSRISSWEPPYLFVDEQLRGPYRLWKHRHGLEPSADGTLVRDRVEYAVLGGSLVERLLVRPDVERVFEYRRTRLEELFARTARLARSA